MKKYLNKDSLKIIVALVFAILFLQSSNLFAQSKIKYYKELFGKEFEFRVFEPDRSKASKEDYLSDNPKRGYLIILTSTIKEDPENREGFVDNNKKVVLICDSKFSEDYPFKFSCNNDSVSSDRGVIVGGFLKSDGSEDFDLYIIPENTLLHPDKRSQITNYLKALKRSDKATEVVDEEGSPLAEGMVKEMVEIREFIQTPTFEIFRISFVMFIIATLTAGILRSLSNEDRKLSFLVLKEDFSYVGKNFSLFQKILFFILLAMFLFYIPLIFFVSLKDGRGIDFNYALSYITSEFNLSKLKNYIENGENLRLLLFTYQIFFLTLLGIFFIPVFVKTIRNAFSKISNAKFKPEIVRYSVPAIIIFLLTVSLLFDLSSSYGFIIFGIIVLSFAFFSKTFDYKYSSKEKISLVFIALLILFSGAFIKFGEKSSEIDYRYEDLIGVSDKIVLLPYSKQIGGKTLVKEYIKSFSEPVFADRYLVYSPAYSRVENKNAKGFVNSGFFYIQNGEIKDIVSAIYSNGELSDMLVSSTPSNFFKVKNFQKGSSEKNPEIQVTFSCDKEELRTDKIKADFYYISSDGKVESENKTLLYFPGCSKVGEPESVIVDFEPPYTEADFLFVYLVGIVGSDIENIKIIFPEVTVDDEKDAEEVGRVEEKNKDGEERGKSTQEKSEVTEEPQYFSIGDGYEIISSGGGEVSATVPVTNYIFGDPYDLNFDMTLDEEGKFNIANPINELIKESVLKDKFLIWSTKRYLPVRLPD